MQREHKVVRNIQKLEDGTYKVTFFIEDFYTETGLKNLIELNKQNLEKINTEMHLFDTERDEIELTIAANLVGQDLINRVKQKKKLRENQKTKFDKALAYAKNVALQANEHNKKSKVDIEEALVWWNDALAKGSANITKTTIIDI